MRTPAFAIALSIGATLYGQVPKDIDMDCCKSGNHHAAKPCGGCGSYSGSALLCFNATDPNLRFVEILVPQRFADLKGVKFKGRVGPMKKRKGARFKLTGPVVRNADGEKSQFAPQWQTVDGSKPTEDYYVRYKIKGR